MARTRKPAPTLPACYAIVQPGLEEVASDEIEKGLRGEVRRVTRGVVVFRLDEIDERVLTLRTTEDVFLFAWGTDQLTHRAEDLDSIQRWTAKEPDWQNLLRIHHAVRPKPKGKPTYRLVTQMEGKHAYLRRDAGKAFARGLAGTIPDSWNAAEENAAVEFWLTIDGATAVCGLRLSDRTMRHRTYKGEHLPASLRPTVAAAMVRLAGVRPGQTVLDPTCGAGTLLAEQFLAAAKFHEPIVALGGDLEHNAVRAATINLRRLGEARLCRWDARRLPLGPASVDHVLCNPPFGKQLSSPEEVGPLYRRLAAEIDRVLRPGGQAVLLTSDFEKLREPMEAAGWKASRKLRVIVLGQPARISVWRKPAAADNMNVRPSSSF
jgi:23S rRNA G2445 N2-methylase RlmL